MAQRRRGHARRNKRQRSRDRERLMRRRKRRNGRAAPPIPRARLSDFGGEDGGGVREEKLFLRPEPRIEPRMEPRMEPVAARVKRTRASVRGDAALMWQSDLIPFEVPTQPAPAPHPPKEYQSSFHMMLGCEV